jgi:hypothetical protein
LSIRSFLLFGLPIALAFFAANPAAAQSVAIIVGSASATPGGIALVPVIFASSNGTQPTAFQWTLSFPATSVT